MDLLLIGDTEIFCDEGGYCEWVNLGRDGMVSKDFICRKCGDIEELKDKQRRLIDAILE